MQRALFALPIAALVLAKPQFAGQLPADSTPSSHKEATCTGRLGLRS